MKYLTDRHKKLLLFCVDYVTTNCDRELQDWIYEKIGEGKNWNVREELLRVLAGIEKEIKESK